MVEMAVPGAKCSELARSLALAIAPFRRHAITEGGAGNGIGLSLEEAPLLTNDSTDMLNPGDMVSLRAGVSDGANQYAIVSAIVEIAQERNALLWSAVA